MERLTSRKPRVSGLPGVCCTHFLSSDCQAVYGNCDGGCLWEDTVWERLAAYEDTGLEPEKVIQTKLALEGKLLSEIKEIEGIPADRAIEILQAEKDGRLVVLYDKARWIKAILDERERQDQKWGYPQENTFCEWASILAEEVGELSQELNELNFGRGDFGLMETEAVQVAAVALSILEQSAVAYGVTLQAAVAIGRLTREEAEAALKKREET